MRSKLAGAILFSLLVMSSLAAIGKVTIRPHTNMADPVPHFLRAGAEYNESQMPNADPLATKNVWMKIPAWMAGTFHFSTINIISYTDLRTGKTTGPSTRRFESTTIWGAQQDKKGGIWKIERFPNRNSALTDNSLSFQEMLSEEPLLVSDSSIVVSRWQRITSLDMITHRVRKTVQVESFATFTPVPDGFRRETSDKIFDEDGTPIGLETAWTIATRTKPFHVVDTAREGTDVRALFRDYLIKNNMADLVPQ